MKDMMKLLAVAALGGSTLLPLSGLQAQAACFGAGCSVSPIPASSFDSTVAAFKTQYADPLAQDMADASVLAGLSSVPMGSIGLEEEGWTIGLGAIGTVEPEGFTNVVVPDVGSYLNLKTVGVGLSPRVYAGVNLGLFFQNSRAFRYMRRFDIYASLFDARYTTGGDQQLQTLSSGYRPTDRTRVSAYYRGLDVRYHLIPRERGASPMFRFNGLSLGLGVHHTRQDISYLQVNSPIQIAQFDGTQIIWNGNNQANMQTNFTSVPIEFMTGIQVLYFMNLNIGGGVSINRGGTSFSVNRFGPVFLASDLEQVAGLQLPEANLFLNVPGDAQVQRYTGFARVGITLNLWALKIDVEAMKAGSASGAQVGLRMEF